MPKKKRGAAARAAKARAARASSQQQKQQLQQQQQQQQQDSEDAVPDIDETLDSSTVSEHEDQEQETTVETSQESLDEVSSEPPPPPEETEAASTPAADNKEEGAESQTEKPPPASEDEKPESESKPATSDEPTTSSAAAANEEVDDDRSFYVNSLLTDKSYLIDVSRGYSDVENLKQPLKCFTTEDELQLFPVIESMSAKLFNIVQKMNACQKKDVEAAMKSKRGVIKIPNLNCKAYLCQLSIMEEAAAAAEKSSPPKRAPHPFLLTEDENMFSEDKLKQLRAVLDAGWKREVVMRSPGSTGRKTGDVYYYSPDGTKFRSSKQVEKHLSDLGETPFTIENFTFAKVRISTNPEQEIVRKAYDGKSPPRAPPKPAPPKSKPPPPPKAESSKSVPKASTSTSKWSPDPSEEPPVKPVSSRRAIQPPKRYSGDAVLLLPKRSKAQDDKHRNSGSNKGLMQMGMLPPKYPKGIEDSSSNIPEGMEYNELGLSHDDSSGSNSVAIKEIAEDSLFQISALRQSGGIDVDNMQQLVESQKQLAQKAAQAALIQEGKQGSSAGSSKRSGGAVIPCSIRCPDMGGAVPNLQCVRCLCLFHAECLGLPPNLQSDHYICSNCTGQQSSSAGMNSQKTMIMKKEKRSPPGLAPIPHGGLRGPAPGRDITVTLAGKEGLSRLPHKIIPSAGGMARGMIRSRGMPPPHIRSSAGQIHHGQRTVMTADGTISMMGTHPQMVKRGRGRPPTVPPSRSLPQISKNLTITHLPRIPGAPPVPNLQPMAASKALPGKIPIPMIGGKPRPGIPAVPNLMKSNAFRLTVPPPSLSGRTFKKPVPTGHHQNPTNLRLNPGATMANKSAAIVHTQAPDRSVSLIKRYPQSVAAIGNKKFVVLPKRRPAEFVPPAPVGNGGLPKGQGLEVVRQNETTTIKKVVSTSEREQVNSTENNLVIDEPMDEGTTETDNIDTTTPMDVGEDAGGVEISTSANESIAANQ